MQQAADDPAYHHPSHRLASAAEHRAYYDVRAQTYDDGFAAALWYALPARLADAVRDVAGVPDAADVRGALWSGKGVPRRAVADLGCGTGLVGRELAGAGLDIDGFDVSPGMLARARLAGAYRDLVEADLTRPLPAGLLAALPPEGYGVVVSAGVFTVGHLRPDALRHALPLGGPAATYLITINEQHFDEAGFDDALAAMVAEGLITAPRSSGLAMYDDPAAPDDPIARARLVRFELTGSMSGPT